MDSPLDATALPGPEAWASLGVTVDRELHAGYQSRVFAARRGAESLVIKLIETCHADTAARARVEMLSGLATVEEIVVGPVPLNGSLVTEIDGWLATAYPHVRGRRPDVTDHADVTSMASSMVRLHRSLSTLEAPTIPRVRSLQGVDLEAHGFGPSQLLHGDFSDTNVLIGDRCLHIIDFDDCGYGPIEFEIGDTLYMMLFDATMNDRWAEYEQFRTWFVAGYEEASDAEVDEAAVDASIELRIQALGNWLDDLSTAPAGIRNSSPEWQAQLRSFVDQRVGPG